MPNHPHPIYMQNPLSQEVWVCDKRLSRRLAAYGWVRVNRIEGKWRVA